MINVRTDNYSLQDIKADSDSDYIIISDLHANGRNLSVELELSDKVRKFFFKNSFAIEYGRNIEVDKSILAIPAVSLVAPVAWAAGVDVIVDTLDEIFLASLDPIRKLFSGWYPRFSSRGKIKVANVVSNNIVNKNMGLMFSAGLDSLTSYIRSRSQHPTLITLLKNDDGRYRYYEKVQNTLKGFAESEKTEIHFIRSGIWDARSTVIDNRLLESEFNVDEWWEEVSHGMITLGLCAPLTMAEGIGVLRLASSGTHNEQKDRHGSHYLLHTNLSWANIDIRYDTFDFTRQSKIHDILKGNRDCYRYLRVCVDPSHYKVADSDAYPRNCGHCEKCLRTITGLLLEGIDPNKCNFRVDDDILSRIKDAFLNRTLRYHTPRFWKDIQEHACMNRSDVEDPQITEKYSTKEFFEWFKDFDLDSYKVDTFGFLRNEFIFSLNHRGAYPTVKQVIGYITHKGIKRIIQRRNNSKTSTDES